MKLDLTGIKNDITPAIHDFVLKKIKKLDKFFDKDTIAHVTFSTRKEIQYVDIRVEYRGKTYIAEECSDDLYSEIETVVDKLLGQIKKQKEKLLDKRTENDMSEDSEDFENIEDAEDT